MARHLFGESMPDWTLGLGATQTVGGVDGLEAVALPGRTVTLWNARTGGSQYTDLTDLSGNPIDHVVTSDGTDGRAVGTVPQFYGPDAVWVGWASADGGPRLLMVSTDVGNVSGPLIENLDANLTAHLGATNPHSTTLASLADVDASGVGDNDALIYDATAGQWVPGDAGGLDPAQFVQTDGGSIVVVAEGDITTQGLRFNIPSGDRTAAGAPDTLAMYWNQGTAGSPDYTRTGFFNEYGELRSIASANSRVPLRVKQHTNSQTGDLTQWTRLDNTVLAWVDAQGIIRGPNLAVAPWLFSKAGVVSTGTGAHRIYNDTGVTLTLRAVRASVGTAPTGSSLIVDVNKNGTTIFCVDPETECMTQRGWTRYDEIRDGDSILAFDPGTRATKWERIRQLFVRTDYRGDIIRIGDRTMGAVTTPEHRWPIESVRYRDLRVVTSEALPKSGYFIRSAPYSDAPNLAKWSDDFVALVAWVVTEGHIAKNARQVTIGQDEKVNPGYVAEIRDILARLATDSRNNREAGITRYTQQGKSRREGLWYCEYGHCTRKSMRYWSLTGSGLASLLEVVDGPSKVPSMEFLLSLTKAQLDLFIETLLKGDGTPRQKRFYQHHEGRMDAYSVAAVLAGWCPTVSADGRTANLYNWHQGQGQSRTRIHKLPKVREPYEGTIWCPVTHSGHWVARRAGQVFITGNTTQANRPTIAAAANTSGKVTNMNIATIADGEYITVDVDAVGSGTAGSDLTVAVWVY